MMHKRRIRGFLNSQFNDGELDDNFVDLLARRVYSGGNVTGRVKENMAVLAKQVVGELKADLVKRNTKQPEHDTTAEEIEGYYIVKNILWNVVDNSDRVVMKDGTAYCAIRLDEQGNRKTICRLYFNTSRKYIGLFDKGSEERNFIESVGKINEHADRIRETARQILAREG